MASTSSRIPLGLQAVFLASNRGKEVHKPPPEKVAAKTFTRNWLFQGLRMGMSGRTRRSKGSMKRQERLEKVKQFGGASASLMSESSHTSVGSLNDEEPVAQFRSKPIKTIIQEPQQKPKSSSARPPMSPQAYLDVMIHSRGYSTRRYRTLQTGYYSKPSEFQQASYHVNLVKLVRNHDVDKFRSVMGSGISPNPCNSYGESLLHMVCRRGDDDLLQIMLDVGSSVQVADDYGRTPLHDACWAATPSFETVEKLANRDITLFHMTDSRGAVPLSYVRREHWPEWIEFLESKKDTWWPPIGSGVDQPSVLVDVAPNEQPIAEPENALSVELAGMVASGVMTPDEARMLQDEDEEMEDADSDDEEEEDSDEESDSDDSDSDEEDSDYDSDDDSDDDDEDSSSCDDDEENEFEGLGMTMADMDDILKRVNYSQQTQMVQ